MGFVQGNVDFDFVRNNFLDLLGARSIRFDHEGVLESTDIAKVAEIGFPGHVLFPHLSRAFPFHGKIGGSVKKVITHLAVLIGQFELLRRVTFHLGFSDVFDFIAFFFVIHEGAFEIRFIKNQCPPERIQGVKYWGHRRRTACEEGFVAERSDREEGAGLAAPEIAP